MRYTFLLLIVVLFSSCSKIKSTINKDFDGPLTTDTIAIQIAPNISFSEDYEFEEGEFSPDSIDQVVISRLNKYTKKYIFTSIEKPMRVVDGKFINHKIKSQKYILTINFDGYVKNVSDITAGVLAVSTFALSGGRGMLYFKGNVTSLKIMLYDTHKNEFIFTREMLYDGMSPVSEKAVGRLAQIIFTGLREVND